MLKKCAKCKKEKDATKFYKSKIHKYNLSPWCIDCQSEFYKKRYWNNREKSLKQSKLYYIANKVKQLKQCKKYRQKNRTLINKRKKENTQKNLNSWIRYFGNKFFYCEICLKKIYYFSGDVSKSVHFDHKQENLSIKRPYSWLTQHYANQNNINIWVKCNFGKLCLLCNRAIPTANRKQWIRKVDDYILKRKRKEE